MRPLGNTIPYEKCYKKNMILNEKIFRAYDIRGEAFVDFDEDGFFVIAAAFGKYIAEKHDIKNPHIFVSGDGRSSMPQLWPAVVNGLKSAECTVTWGGAIPTPVNYYAFHEGNFDASIQISASHNPPADNGLKFVDRTGAVCGEEIQKIKKIAQCFECPKGEKYGVCENTCETKDFAESYIEKILEIQPHFPEIKGTVVVDAGNAIPGMFYPELFRKLGLDISELHCDLDPNFPNHQPDPERPENLEDLIQKVKERKATWGLAFDGDGDRAGIVTAKGEILNADKILYVLSADFLSRNPGAPIVVDAMSSAVLAEKINQLGGKAVRSKTGHSYIEETMHETGARLGGEQSGHFMLGENFYGHDDAALAAIRFLEAVTNNPELLTDVTERWPKLLEFSEKFSVPDEEKFEILEKVTAELLAQFPDADTTDGIRIDFNNEEWAIIRCSNTSPKIAVRTEAKDKESLEEKKSVLVGVLEKNI